MEKVIEEYVALYSRDLTRLCISLCRNKSDADDLFQETWYKAIKNFSKYKNNLSFDKWLFSICVNTYKDNKKLSYNNRILNFQSDKEQSLILNSIPVTDPQELNDYYELHKALSTLPKKLKITLTLFYFKDYSVKEISEILNIPTGTVKSRLNSAKKAVKRRLQNEE